MILDLHKDSCQPRDLKFEATAEAFVAWPVRFQRNLQILLNTLSQGHEKGKDSSAQSNPVLMWLPEQLLRPAALPPSRPPYLSLGCHGISIC